MRLHVHARHRLWPAAAVAVAAASIGGILVGGAASVQAQPLQPPPGVLAELSTLDDAYASLPHERRGSVDVVVTTGVQEHESRSREESSVDPKPEDQV